MKIKVIETAQKAILNNSVPYPITYILECSALSLRVTTKCIPKSVVYCDLDHHYRLENAHWHFQVDQHKIHSIAQPSQISSQYQECLNDARRLTDKRRIWQRLRFRWRRNRPWPGRWAGWSRAATRWRFWGAAPRKRSDLEVEDRCWNKKNSEYFFFKAGSGYFWNMRFWNFWLG